MNNPVFPQLDPLKCAKAILKENDKTLREVFRGKINGSFLIKIKNAVFNKLGSGLLQYYPIHFDNFRIMTGTDATPEYDVCRIIIGIHRHHSIFLSENEIHINQKNSDYQQQIIDEVIEKIQIYQLSCMFFRKSQLLLGDEFLFFPVPYELFATCMRAIQLISNCSIPLAVYCYDLVGLALSSLSLMENNLLSNAYPLCRSMIELYLKILVLRRHPEAYKDYERFCTFEIEQSCCSQTYPQEFVTLYNARKYMASQSKVNYLHFGWLDSVDDYDIEATNRYSIYGILDYLKRDDNLINDLTYIEPLYKMCHGYAHGSTVHVSYPLLQYFEISCMIYCVIRPVFADICGTDKIESSDTDKLLLAALDRDFKKLKEQYGKRSTDNFESYYRLHHFSSVP